MKQEKLVHQQYINILQNNYSAAITQLMTVTDERNHLQDELIKHNTIPQALNRIIDKLRSQVLELQIKCDQHIQLSNIDEKQTISELKFPKVDIEEPIVEKNDIMKAKEKLEDRLRTIE